MLREKCWLSVGLTVVALGMFFTSGVATAQDEPTDPVKLVGGTSLVPPEGAENQDATGSVRLFQWGERMALHVKVRHLEPGATYDVVASRTVTPDEGDPVDEVETIGSITTHDGTPPAPRCFNACLEPPAEEPAEGEAGGFMDGWHHGDRDPSPWSRPRCSGTALLYVDREGTSLSFCVYVRGLQSPVDTMQILDAEGNVVLELPVGETLKGAVDVDETQLAALATGETVLVVTTTGDDTADPAIEPETVEGIVKPCFSFLDDWRAKVAARRAGSGALCLDTKREDAMPFGVGSIDELVGVTITVKSGETDVLVGTVDEVKEIIPWHRRTHEEPADPAADDGAGGGGSLQDEADALALADSAVYFEVGEIHDASFLRGDVNDDGQIDIVDPVFLLLNLFRGGASGYCLDAADADDNGAVNLSDPILILQVLFQGRSDMPSPYPERGFDSTVDTLFCGSDA